ncbi:unnamed protein product, partial [Oppiella nova]
VEARDDVCEEVGGSKIEILLKRMHTTIVVEIMPSKAIFFTIQNFITGTALLDLQMIYKATFTQISYMNTVWTATYSIGAMSITTAITPHLVHVEFLILNLGINGIGCGSIDAVSSVWIVEMWAENCGPYAQGLQFVLGIGALVSPQMINPFLSQPFTKYIDVNNINKAVNETGTYGLSTNVSLTSVANTTVMEIQGQTPSMITIPYLFIGSIAVGGGIFIGGLNFYKKYVPRKIESQNTSANKDNGSKISRMFYEINDTFITEMRPTNGILLLIVLLANMIAFVTCIQWTWSLYWTSFAQFIALDINPVVSNDILTLMLGMFTLSRGVCIVTARYISPILLIYVSLLLLLISQILLFIFANTSLTLMWVVNVIVGLGLGPIFAAIYQMLESITPVTNLMGAFFIFLIGLFMTVFNVVLGIYIESQPMIYVYITLGCVIISIILFIFIHLLIATHINNEKKDLGIDNDGNTNSADNSTQGSVDYTTGSTEALTYR